MEFNPSNLTTEREGATVTLSQAHLAYDTALWDYQYEEMVMAVILKRLPGLRVIEEQAVLGLWTEKDEIRHANEKPMTAPPSKVPRMAIASRSLERYDGRIVRRLAHLAKEEVEDIYKDYTSDQLKKVVDEYFEKTERELKKKLDDAAATMKAAQEAHSKELGRCYALAQYQMKEARALRRAYEDENGEGPNFSLDLPEVEDAVQWGSPFDLAVHTKPSLPPSPSSDDEDITKLAIRSPGRPPVREDGICCRCPAEIGLQRVTNKYGPPLCATCSAAYLTASSRYREKPFCSGVRCTPRDPCNACKMVTYWADLGLKPYIPHKKK